MKKIKLLAYRGPLMGKIRTIFNRKKVKSMYKDMLDEVSYRYLHDRVGLEEAIRATNHANRNNDMGMYLFVDRERSLIAFGFRDAWMSDQGNYELIG